MSTFAAYSADFLCENDQAPAAINPNIPAFIVGECSQLDPATAAPHSTAHKSAGWLSAGHAGHNPMSINYTFSVLLHKFAAVP